MDYVNGKNSSFSRWASESEIMESLHKMSIENFDTKLGGIPFLCRAGDIYIEYDDIHSLILGATGSKKSRLIGMPTLQIYAHAGESFIATDPKAELYERTLPLLKEKGYNIFVLNLRDPKKSNGWNPMTIPYNLYRSNQQDRAIETVLDLANGMMQKSVSANDPYWHNSAADFLAGLILILFECAKNENEINFKSLQSLKNQALCYTDNSEEIPYIKEQFLDHLDKNVFVHSLLCGTVDVCEKTRSCIVSVFNQAMQSFFSQDNLINMLSVSEIDMCSIGKEKTAVFLIMPDENTLYHQLVSIFIKQCYSELILEAQKYSNKKLPVRVNFLLDEFASLPVIMDFPSMITASRSRNMRFNLFIQGINQLEQRYGRDAETIKGNCENWIFLFSREISLLNELVNLAGKRNEEEQLVSVPMLQTLSKDKGEALIFTKRHYPFKTNLFDIDAYCPENYDIMYPENKNKVNDIFDFEEICKEGPYYISGLFNGKKMTDEELFEKLCASSDEKYEPVFTSHIPDDDEIEVIINKIGAI